MAGLEMIAPEARESVARIGQAALVVALPACRDCESLVAIKDSVTPMLAALLPGQTTVLLLPDTAETARNWSGEAAPAGPTLLPYPLALPERFGGPALEQGLRSASLVAHALSARACVVSGSDTGAAMAEQVRALAEPVLNHGYDLAVPLLTRRKYSALINSSIVYPLTRALYGARVSYPMTPDAGFSSRLIDNELRRAADRNGVAGWAATRAVRAGLQVCQVHRDASPASAGLEATNLSEALSHILGWLFAELEQTAGFWQKVRGSQPVRAFGQRRPADSEAFSVDVHPMIETFQRGCRDLFDIWAAILTPATQVELRKLAKLPLERFRLGDEAWAHVIYDYALGYRQRVISREHLLGSLTPIYLGWVASYALEVGDSAPEAADERIEMLCVSFEKLKPYLLSRWRWPDRFNP